ncbi:putative ribonuclease H-like domain-containing protein [Tanacetum coccineum]|uniref:Ribonuclease H-like domain-containing protein n=1 Tax=Tanacetum coccineum TaxID=301880 RepID=A0ABQ5J3T5_9ASTR
MIDYALWEAIKNGATLPKTTVVEGVEKVMPITFVEDKAQRRLKVKARSTLMIGIPNEHQLKFNSIKDAKLLLEVVEKRFGRNAATKKTQRNLLKQLQKLMSLLKLLGEKLLQEDVNQKLLRSLSPEWNTHAVVWRNKGELETMSMDDLYNNLKVYEPEVKGMSSSSSSTQNMAFVSSSNNNTSSSNKAVNEDLQQIHPDDIEEMNLRWKMAMLTMRARRFLKNIGRKLTVNGNETISFDKSKVECYNYHKRGHFAKECRAPRNQDNKNKESSRRSVPMEISTSTSLVSCDVLVDMTGVIRFENVSKSLNKIIKCQIVDNYKKGLGYEKFNAVPPPYTINFMPPTPDLSFTSLDEFVNKPVVENRKSDEEVPKGNPQMDLQDQGVTESGCSRHMIGNMSYLTDYKEIDGGYVTFGGNPKGGKITGKVSHKVLFNDTECIVLSPNFKLIDESQVLLRVLRKNNMYSVDLKNIVPKGGLTCLFAKFTYDESKLWHRRLGHLNFKTMNKLVKGNLVRGLPSKLFENDQTCVACQKGKQYRASCKSKTENSISLPLHLLHMDLFGPTFVKSLMKKMYCLVVTDDYSRFTWVFFLATKDETSGILKSFITGIYNQVDYKIKVIRTPQQNGVAERRNRTLIEAARTMLADSKLPTTFWAEAVNTACYVQNRVLVVKPHNKTPYELFHGRTPTLSFMRPFGCPVTILNTIDHLGKFDGKADEGFFVGYSLNSKAFRVFNSRTRIVEENLHIRFSESTPNAVASDNACQARKEKEPVKDYILLPLWTADPLYSQDPKSSHDDGSKPSSDDGKKVDEDPRKDSECNDQEKEDNVNNTNTVNAAGSNKVNAVGEKISIELPFDPNMPALEDVSIFDFSRDDDDDVGAEANINNLDTTIQVSPIPTTRIHKDHPFNQVIRDLESATQTRKMSKNLEEHGNKKDEREIMIRNKARLVAQGYTQEERIDYDEVFATIARIEAIRLFLAFALFKDFVVYQMDVKSAFLYGKIEEEVEKALYGLHQAPRAWYETLSTYLLDNGFQREKIDKTLFIKRHKGHILMVQVYVDDIIFGLTKKELCNAFEKLMHEKFQMSFYGRNLQSLLRDYKLNKKMDGIFIIYVDDFISGSTKKELCNAFEKLMHEKFQMSSMGEFTFFLGLQVQQKKDGIFISQDRYVVEILKKFGFTEFKTASTPTEIQKPLLKDEDSEEVNVHMYRSMIGSLMYLTSSRPHIMFAVCACARYQVNPKVLHLHAMKRIFRYLKGQPKLGLWYPKDSPFDLVAYTDSDYVRANLDRKSTTGGKAKKSVKLMMEKLCGMELELMPVTQKSHSTKRKLKDNSATDNAMDRICGDINSPINNMYELKIRDEFLKILRDNAFNGMDGGDVIDHIARVVEITKWIKVPEIDKTGFGFTETPDDLDNGMDYFEFLYWLASKFDNHWELDKTTRYGLWEFYVNERTNGTIGDLQDEPRDKHSSMTCSDSFYKPYMDTQDGNKTHKIIDKECSPILVPACHDICDQDELCKTEEFTVIRYSMGLDKEFVAVEPSKISNVKRTPGSMKAILRKGISKIISATNNVMDGICGDINSPINNMHELKIRGEFLKILREKTFNDMDKGDVIDHIARVVKITEWIKFSTKASRKHPRESCKIPPPLGFPLEDPTVFKRTEPKALGWNLEEIHVTWAHLEKKRTRLRLYTKNHADLFTHSDGIATIKRRHHDIHGDGVRDSATASGPSSFHDKCEAKPSLVFAYDCMKVGLGKRECKKGDHPGNNLHTTLPLMWLIPLKRTITTIESCRDCRIIPTTTTVSASAKSYKTREKSYDDLHQVFGAAANTIELPVGNNVVPLRSDTIRLVQNGYSFHGLRSEDPNQHLKDFLKIVNSLDLDSENRERTRLHLFQFSLRGQASNWLDRLPIGSITTWEDLTTHFLAQFFPPGRTAKLHNDILIGPHNTQYCLEDLEQAFIEYASSRTDEAGGKWYTFKPKQNNLDDTYNPSWKSHPNLSFNNQSNLERMYPTFMASRDARLSKFEADFKQQQSEMTNKVDTILKAITDRIEGTLPSHAIKNPKLSTSLVLSARSYPAEDPQCSTHVHGSINTITIHPKQQNDSRDSMAEGE